MFQFKKPVELTIEKLPNGRHTAEIKMCIGKETDGRQSVGVCFASVIPESRACESVWKNYNFSGENTNPVLAARALKALFRTCEADTTVIDQLVAGKAADLDAIVGTRVNITVEHGVTAKGTDYTNVSEITLAEDGDQLSPEHTGDDSIGQKQRKLAVAGR